MLELVLSILASLAVVIGILYIHELGHYIAGRFIVEIPQSEITIVMRSIPQHVALRGPDGWVSPAAWEDYTTLYERYDPTLAHVEAYIGAGEVVQTIGVVGIAGFLALTGFESIASSIILISILMTGIYLVYDAVVTQLGGHPAGDYSALWMISPRTAVAVLLLFTIPHIGAYLVI